MKIRKMRRFVCSNFVCGQHVLNKTLPPEFGVCLGVFFYYWFFVHFFSRMVVRCLLLVEFMEAKMFFFVHFLGIFCFGDENLHVVWGISFSRDALQRVFSIKRRKKMLWFLIQWLPFYIHKFSGIFLFFMVFRYKLRKKDFMFVNFINIVLDGSIQFFFSFCLVAPWMYAFLYRGLAVYSFCYFVNYEFTEAENTE